jgi:hypothetical protein
MRLLSGVLVIVYLLVGVIVAANNDYLADVEGLRAVISALLAVLLWPLVVLGIDLHIGKNGGDGKAAAIAVVPVGRAAVVLGRRMFGAGGISLRRTTGTPGPRTRAERSRLR